MKALKTSFISSFGFAFLFALFSVIFYFGNWDRLMIVSFLGFFVGLIAAPEMAPQAFKYPWLLQISSGLAAGLIAGLFFDLISTNLLLATLFGGLIGGIAPFWVKHIDIP